MTIEERLEEIAYEKDRYLTKLEMECLEEYREKQKETIAEVLMFAASLLIALFLFIWALPRG